MFKIIDVRFIMWTDICNYDIHSSYPVSSLPSIRIILTNLLLAISKQTFSFMNNVYNGLFDQGCINPATTFSVCQKENCCVFWSLVIIIVFYVSGVVFIAHPDTMLQHYYEHGPLRIM